MANGDCQGERVVAQEADHDITVIVPAYNEEARLPWTLAGLAKFLDAWKVDYRVLVANDGSSDNTAALADGFGPRFSTLTLVPQGGKGRAVRAAMLQATGRIVSFTDADLPFDLDALKVGYEWINAGQCDIVFGARDIVGASRVVTRKIMRRIATRMFRALMQQLISREVSDTQCGLKVFRRQAAVEIFSRTTIDGFAFDAEVVLLTHRLNLPFRRVPVTLVNDYGSALSLRRHTLPMIVDVLKLWWRTRRESEILPNNIVAPKAVQHEGSLP
jgi:dolichyl-phosphate beta-glucosyltransferase